MKCDICIRPAKPHSISCYRCFGIVNATKFYRHPRRLCLDVSYDELIDRFRCCITNIPMIDDDPLSPYYVHCCQRIPGQPLDRLAVCAFISMFKSDLSDTELVTVIPHLDDHFARGIPFNKDIIPFRYWRRSAPPPPKEALLWGMPPPGTAKKCAICIRLALPRSKYCPRCRKIIFPKPNWVQTAAGMKEYYDPEADGFRCAYTDILLNDCDIFDPWYMVMDHVVPGQKKVVPAAFWVNDMKGCMTAAGFKKAIAESANHIRTGEPFDTGVITRDDWKRSLMHMRIAGRKIA